MRTFFSYFKVLTLLLTFLVSQSAWGLPPCAPCGTGGTCGAFPTNLAYQCLGKGALSCNPKSPNYKECCEGLYVTPYYGSAFDCPYWPYIPGDSACCGTEQYSKEWQGCCDGKTYFVDYHTCCEGDIVPWEYCCNNKRIDPETTGCCQGKPYNYQTQACCDGKVVCASPVIRLKANNCKGCVQRDPSCFYAAIEGVKGYYFAEPTDDGQAAFFLDEALCPNQKVEICMHPRCGTSPKITGNPKDGFVVEGVCKW